MATFKFWIGDSVENKEIVLTRKRFYKIEVDFLNHADVVLGTVKPNIYDSNNPLVEIELDSETSKWRNIEIRVASNGVKSVKTVTGGFSGTNPVKGFFNIYLPSSIASKDDSKKLIVDINTATAPEPEPIVPDVPKVLSDSFKVEQYPKTPVGFSAKIISGDLVTIIPVNGVVTNYNYTNENGRKLRLTCLDGYEFKSVSESATLPPINNITGKTTVDIDINSLMIGRGVEVELNKKELPPEPTEKFFEVIVNGENLNSVINYYPMGGFTPDVYPVENGVPVLLPAKDFGITLGRADLVSIANDGFIITSAKNEMGDIPFDPEKVTYSLSGSVIDDKRYTTFTITTDGDITPPDPSEKSIMNNYFLTDSELMEFQKKVYDVVNTESVNEGRGALELTNFLNSVKVFPFIISEEDLGVRESIKIRDKQLNTATRIIKDSIKLNLGIIEFKKEFDNSLDYMGVKIEVFLPFCNGSISLQPSEVIGKNILIIANVNVYDGAVTINFKDSETYLNISSANFGANFPFFNLYDIKQSDLSPNQAVNTLLQAYALVTKPNYVSGRKMATRHGKLGSDSGYVEVIDISLKTVAYLEEKQQILSLLNRGVKIC